MKKTIKLFLALTVVVFAVSSCKSKQQITKISSANKVATPTTEVKKTDEVKAEPVVTQKTTVPVEEVSTPPETKAESFKLTDGDANNMQQKYHVCVGSFKIHSNAKNLNAKLVSEGNKSMVVQNAQGMYRVLIASFNDYKDAKALIKKIDGRFPGSWVLIQK